MKSFVALVVVGSRNLLYSQADPPMYDGASLEVTQ
jgi:hypothetical protein